MTIDPITLPWTWEYATGGEHWAVVRDSTGDLIARVQAKYVQGFVQLPELVTATVLTDVLPTPTEPTKRGKK